MNKLPLNTLKSCLPITSFPTPLPISLEDLQTAMTTMSSNIISLTTSISQALTTPSRPTCADTSCQRPVVPRPRDDKAVLCLQHERQLKQSVLTMIQGWRKDGVPTGGSPVSGWIPEYHGQSQTGYEVEESAVGLLAGRQDELTAALAKVQQGLAEVQQMLEEYGSRKAEQLEEGRTPSDVSF
ncbi:hypothetical protein BU24DRAFT_118392 [Aaosphaeria arxii CBS 175.79]|uniref:Uncharacterized protein n=1 Tax=Aaosphaeria arxii CBS 175.79 TaxID=1450172 RepID=A0A6A5Y4C8_9PLEO|nr:uncharacterized protein BU24DRAFT_118392 [Aaosphaeria arxii CBS 175.79]KAF2019364.1 hypothetical protein BU24DRAFT_118392 [Aaosphaeria arxii CBS 175.79]